MFRAEQQDEDCGLRIREPDPRHDDLKMIM
jgi:hypothetical protein